jgi:hypothetical protein
LSMSNNSNISDNSCSSSSVTPGRFNELVNFQVSFFLFKFYPLFDCAFTEERLFADFDWKKQPS